MIHDNVWFSFKAGVDEELGLVRCRVFLQDLQSRGRIDGFQLLKNLAAADEAKLPPFHAIIRFRDHEQTGTPFDEVRTADVFLCGRGAMIEKSGPVCRRNLRRLVTPPPVAAMHQQNSNSRYQIQWPIPTKKSPTRNCKISISKPDFSLTAASKMIT
jgi:hypothetical protein